MLNDSATRQQLYDSAPAPETVREMRAKRDVPRDLAVVALSVLHISPVNSSRD